MAVLFDKDESIENVLKAQAGDRKARNKCGEYILALVNSYWKKPRWRTYVGAMREAMNDQAIIYCVKAIDKWKPDRNCTPYSFWQMIIWQQFTTASRNFKHLDIPISILNSPSISQHINGEYLGTDL